MNLLKLIFGNKINLQEVISNGSVILDVRTKSEYQSGHLRNSINIPIDNLQKSIKELDKNKPIITCCASGSRSAYARRILKSNGFENVYNGGSWFSLRKYISWPSVKILCYVELRTRFWQVLQLKEKPYNAVQIFKLINLIRLSPFLHRGRGLGKRQTKRINVQLSNHIFIEDIFIIIKS